MRGSEWLSLRRCLALLRRMQLGPAAPHELIGYVLVTVGNWAYPEAPSAREKAFKRDRENLKKRLGVDFYYSPKERVYILVDPGPLFRLQLSETSLRAIYLLSQSFEGHVGEHSNIKTFLDEVFSYLSAETKLKIDAPELHLDLDIQQDIDPNHISKKVWETIHRAIKGHRKLTFNYIAPSYEDRQKRLHQVVPIRLQYQGGHWYLRAYRLMRRDVNGVENREAAHLKFRLSYIQEDERLSVSATVAPRPPAPPIYPVHYRLLPPLSRGIISEHFSDMVVEEFADGSKEIKGYCDDPWEAGRLFLSYGEFCIVLGGDEVKAWMEKSIQQMLKNYLQKE